MKLRGYIMALLMVCALTPSAIAQSNLNANEPTSSTFPGSAIS